MFGTSAAVLIIGHFKSKKERKEREQKKELNLYK